MPCRRPSQMEGRRPHLHRAIAAWRRLRARAPALADIAIGLSFTREIDFKPSADSQPNG
jgi:hypothetical protein